jgi:hypothetical protein
VGYAETPSSDLAMAFRLSDFPDLLTSLDQYCTLNVSDTGAEKERNMSDVLEIAHRIRPIELDSIESPIVRAGLAYWQKLRAGRKFPSRSDIQPRDMKDLLKNVMLLRVIGDCEDYEYRILGDAHLLAHGFTTWPDKLSRVEEYRPGYNKILKSVFDMVVKPGSPYALRGWIETGQNFPPFMYSENLLLPIGPNSVTVDHVLNFSVYLPTDRLATSD